MNWIKRKMIEISGSSYSCDALPDNVVVGKYSSIATKVIFHQPGDNHRCVVNKRCVYTTNWDQPVQDGQTTIGNDVWIGEGARIMFGVTIGDGAIIGAGAVIGKDVPPYAVVVGNPQQIKRYRFAPDIIKQLLGLQWWNLDHKIIEELKQDMLDIDRFLLKCQELHL